MPSRIPATAVIRFGGSHEPRKRLFCSGPGVVANIMRGSMDDARRPNTSRRTTFIRTAAAARLPWRTHSSYAAGTTAPKAHGSLLTGNSVHLNAVADGVLELGFDLPGHAPALEVRLFSDEPVELEIVQLDIAPAC